MVLQRTIKEPLFLRVSHCHLRTHHTVLRLNIYIRWRSIWRTYTVHSLTAHIHFEYLREHCFVSGWFIQTKHEQGKVTGWPWGPSQGWMRWWRRTRHIRAASPIVPCHLTPAITGAILNFFCFKERGVLFYTIEKYLFHYFLFFEELHWFIWMSSQKLRR